MNPYRTGVLIGNHTEDRFGSELAEAPSVKWNVPKAEMKAKYTVQGSMYAAGRDNFKTKPANEDEIVSEKVGEEFARC